MPIIAEYNADNISAKLWLLYEKSYYATIEFFPDSKGKRYGFGITCTSAFQDAPSTDDPEYHEFIEKHEVHQ